ncbi:MAG: tetratricopeptide repeat protein [Spirochaetes bacterium]|nr:tetratricopeptide repeat protein [Spirochaetota bacterium]
MKFPCIIIISIFLLSCSNIQKSQELYNKALTQYLEKNFSIAKELCLQSIKEAKNPEALLLLSKIYFFTNHPNFEDTIQQYISLTESTQGYTLYARWQMRQNKFKDAKTLLQKALEHSPYDPAASYMLGSIHYAEKEYDEAIISFYKAFANYYFLMLIHKQLATIYSDIGLADRSSKHTIMVKAITAFDKEFPMEE